MSIDIIKWACEVSNQEYGNNKLLSLLIKGVKLNE